MHYHKNSSASTGNKGGQSDFCRILMNLLLMSKWHTKHCVRSLPYDAGSVSALPYLVFKFSRLGLISWLKTMRLTFMFFSHCLRQAFTAHDACVPYWFNFSLERPCFHFLAGSVLQTCQIQFYFELRCALNMWVTEKFVLQKLLCLFYQVIWADNWLPLGVFLVLNIACFYVN